MTLYALLNRHMYYKVHVKLCSLERLNTTIIVFSARTARVAMGVCIGVLVEVVDVQVYSLRCFLRKLLPSESDHV